MLRPLRAVCGRALPALLRDKGGLPGRSGSSPSAQQYATAMQAGGELARGLGFTASGSTSRHSSSTPLLHFFNRAKEVVHGKQIHEQQNVQELVNLMSGISLEELGLDPDSVQDPYAGALRLNLRDSIKYLRIYEDSTMTLGMFCFPTGTAIPLHNHPGMTVFSRLMFGNMRVTAFDWLDPRRVPVTAGAARARLVMDATLSPECPPLVLFPSSGAMLGAARFVGGGHGHLPPTVSPLVGGNLHEFTALTPCVVLDLLTPPYAPPERDCTYYRVQQPPLTWPVQAGGSGRRHKATPQPVTEQEVDLEVYEPHDFEVVSGLYAGQPVT